MQAPTGERIVEVRTLDDLAREHEMDMIDFVKIDVEGAEGAVVHGMRDLLSHSARAATAHRSARRISRADAEARSRRCTPICAPAGLSGSERAEDRPTVRAIAYGRRVTPAGCCGPLDPRTPLAVISHQLWLAPGATT
jgi:hypothetical protein